MDDPTSLTTNLIHDNDKNDSNVVSYSESYRPPFLPLLLLVFPIMPLFWTYHVLVTKDTLSFGYSSRLTMRTVNRGDNGDNGEEVIESAVPIDYINGLTSFGGWGIRLNLSGDVGYIANNGPAVKIILLVDQEKNKRRTYVFNCEDPQKVCDLLKNTNKSINDSK
jgi:hypothetical protein